MKILKWLGVVVLVLVVLVVGAVQYMKSQANARYARTWDIDPADMRIPWPLSEEEIAQIVAGRAKKAEAENPNVPAKAEDAPPAAPATERPSDEELSAIAMERAIARGKHIITSRATCHDCHGKDFGGFVIVDDPAIGKWVAPNITPSGVVKDYQPKDWVRILRHGINKDRTSSTMPAIDYTYMSDQELSDMVAYVKSLPPVDRTMPPSDFGPIHHLLVSNGGIPISAELIDHTAPRPKTPPVEAPTADFGKHIITVCMGCHGPTLSGGPIPGGPPEWPPAANLTMHESGLAKWSKEDFVKSMREGKRPDGSDINAVAMPWKSTANLRDLELEAMWAYLKSAPPVAFGNR